MDKIDLLNGLVNKWYEMDPETEDVVPTGAHLQIGMIVLIEDPVHRMDTKRWQSWDNADWRMAKVRNRWGKVLYLELTPNEREITILLEFEPGEKMQHTIVTNAAWIVKKHSIPTFESFITDFAESIGAKFLGTISFRDLLTGNIPGFNEKETPEAETPTARNKCPLKSLRDGGDCVFDEGHRFEGLPYCLSRVENEEVPGKPEENQTPGWEQQLKDFDAGLKDGEEGKV